MKLDDTVCRGSLIINNGITYVVLGLHTTATGTNAASEWKVIPALDIKVGRVAGFSRFLQYEDVDMFFPGEAFPLEDYVR